MLADVVADPSLQPALRRSPEHVLVHAIRIAHSTHCAMMLVAKNSMVMRYARCVMQAHIWTSVHGLDCIPADGWNMQTSFNKICTKHSYLCAAMLSSLNNMCNVCSQGGESGVAAGSCCEAG